MGRKTGFKRSFIKNKIKGFGKKGKGKETKYQPKE